MRLPINSRHVLGLLGAGALLLSLPGFGQTASHAPPNTPNAKRIEGTIARVDGNELLLKVKGGTTETYQLSPAVQMIRSRPGQMSDLSAGKIVGCTSIYNQGGTVLAGECHISPDGMQGIEETHGTTQTADADTINGTVTDVRNDGDSAPGKIRRIFVQITYREGATVLTVTSLTKIYVITAGDASALKPGVRVRGVSQQGADGTGVIQRLTIMTAGRGQTSSTPRAP